MQNRVSVSQNLAERLKKLMNVGGTEYVDQNVSKFWRTDCQCERSGVQNCATRIDDLKKKCAKCVSTCRSRFLYSRERVLQCYIIRFSHPLDVEVQQ